MLDVGAPRSRLISVDAGRPGGKDHDLGDTDR